jgi:hypothetical protein
MPKLPSHQSAEIAERKLAHYLLEKSHPDGGPKAWFLEKFGYTIISADLLRSALLQHAAANDIDVQRTTPFGTVYELVGRLSTPDGRNPMVRSVWIIDRNGATPRFVTLVPARERKS